MFRSAKNKKNDFHITIDLDEPITGDTCSKLIMEVVKYILYQKQQIPMSYDTLTKLFANSKPSDRNYTMMQNLFTTLCNVSDQLAAQFIQEKCNVREILIIVGPTVVSPKFCLRFEVPVGVLSSREHSAYEHSHRKPLLNVMKCLLACNEFQDELITPLGPTNTFVLVQKKDASKVSNFFLPKPQFSTKTHNVPCFHVNFKCHTEKLNCSCHKLIKVFDEYSNKLILPIYDDSKELTYQWYQSKEIFKGFKFSR